MRHLSHFLERAIEIIKMALAKSQIFHFRPCVLCLVSADSKSVFPLSCFQLLVQLLPSPVPWWNFPWTAKCGSRTSKQRRGYRNMAFSFVCKSQLRLWSVTYICNDHLQEVNQNHYHFHEGGSTNGAPETLIPSSHLHLNKLFGCEIWTEYTKNEEFYILQEISIQMSS